jgi:hypothetical protein
VVTTTVVTFHFRHESGCCFRTFESRESGGLGLEAKYLKPRDLHPRAKFKLHFNFISISFQFHFNFISISFQFHSNFISISFQFHFNSTLGNCGHEATEIPEMTTSTATSPPLLCFGKYFFQYTIRCKRPTARPKVTSLFCLSSTPVLT